MPKKATNAAATVIKVAKGKNTLEPVPAAGANGNGDNGGDEPRGEQLEFAAVWSKACKVRGLLLQVV